LFSIFVYTSISPLAILGARQFMLRMITLNKDFTKLLKSKLNGFEALAVAFMLSMITLNKDFKAYDDSIEVNYENKK